jgi:CHAD domain-containing protein
MKRLSDQIVDRINKNFSRINILLNGYLKNPNEKNIHNIRKSIRRGESAYVTLPKKYRKKKNIKNFIDQSKSFFKVNSQIRDYDIYLQKIENYRKINNTTATSITFSSKNTNNNNSNNDILSTIQNYRKSNLRDATTAAEKLKTLQYPQIKKNNKKVQKKIDSRFRKITKKFSKKIQKNLPLVINDETKVEELHTLRKDCKELRYILELKYKNKKDKNQDEDDPHTKSIMQLEDLQDSLGQIHDCDAILSFFEKLENYPESKPLMNKESKIRKDLYRKFVDKYLNSIQQDMVFIN